MTAAEAGLILSAMAKELHHRLTTTTKHHPEAARVLWPIYMTLLAGTEEALKLAKESLDE
jgi:hypothetical protein